MSLKKIKKITEEYYKSILVKGNSMTAMVSGLKGDTNVDIFRNPSKQELYKLFKEFGYVRFTIGDALYVWDGRILHGSVMDDEDYKRMEADTFQGKMFPDKIELYMNILGYRDEEEFEDEEDVKELTNDFLSDPDVSRFGYSPEQVEWVIG